MFIVWIYFTCCVSSQISSANISKTSRSNTSINSKQDSTKPKKTEVKPFSFESRDKERYTKKEEKIKEYIQEEEKVCDLQFGIFLQLNSYPLNVM